MKRLVEGTRRRAAALALLLAPAVGSAHDLWIEPSTFHPAVGETVSAALRTGQKLEGEPLPRVPSFVDRFVLKGSGAELPLDGRPGADPAGWARVGEAGRHWIGYQSTPYPIVIEAPKFEQYLKDEGLERIVEERARKGQSGAQGRERFYRCAKALLSTGDAAGGVFDVPLGFTLELVPKKDPYSMKGAGDLPLALTFRGKPAAGVLVVAMSKTDPEKAVSARTDAKGFVKLRLPHPGFWLIKAVHMEPAPADSGVDWESWWASVTFELRGK